MFSGLPVRLHHRPPSRNASTRWPGATPSDLSLFRSLILSQTDAAVIRGMERTMDVIGEMVHRAGLRPVAPLSPQRPTNGEEEEVGHRVPVSTEKDLGGRPPFGLMGWIPEDVIVGTSEPTTSEDVERIHHLSTFPRMRSTRPSSVGGKSGSTVSQALRQSSITDVWQIQVSVHASPSGHLETRSGLIPTDSGSELFVPLDQIDMLLDAETIARMMVAAGQSILRPYGQKTVFPQHQKSGTFHETTTERKSLKDWLSSDVVPQPEPMYHPAFADEIIRQGGTPPQWRIPSVPYIEANPTEASKGRSGAPPFERFMNLKGNFAANGKPVDGKMGSTHSKVGHRAIESASSIPRDSDIEEEPASRVEMLRRRRQDVDTLDPRDSMSGYPDEEELKAIQCDIRARIVQAWARQEGLVTRFNKWSL